MSMSKTLCICKVIYYLFLYTMRTMSKNLTGILGLVLFIGVSAGLTPRTSQAYSYPGYKWPTNAVTVDFGSPTIPSTWITPISKGLTPWNATASPFTFSAGTSTKDITVSNMGAGAPLAVTTTVHTATTISDSDLNFNSYHSWSTTGAAGKYDVQNVSTHEFGHFLLLGDLYTASDSEKTMYYNAATGETKKRTLHSDDTNGINAIYP